MKAEERLTANPKPSDGADGDRDKIEEILRDYLPPGISAYEFRSSAVSSADSIVTQHWRVVEAVARALLDDKMLTEHRFAEIVKSVSP
jgi:hypothetical protein